MSEQNQNGQNGNSEVQRLKQQLAEKDKLIAVLQGKQGEKASSPYAAQEQQLAQAQRDVLTSLVRLYTSLGGGWE